MTNLSGGSGNSTSLVVGLGNAVTSSAGLISGSVPVNLVSSGSNSGLANTALPTQTLTVQGAVYRLAAANTLASLNLGNHHVGDPVSAGVLRPKCDGDGRVQ